MNRTLAAVLVTLLVAGMLSGWGSAAAATCIDGLAAGPRGPVADPGARLPVIMVHGWRSSATVWDELVSDMNGAGVADLLAPIRFDYEAVNTQWVTHADIGPLLGEWIDCVAMASAEQGGPGKVALVGHSMGGLAIRQALGLDASRDGKVAFVGTLGTPNLGSPLGGEDAINATRASAARAIGLESLPVLLALADAIMDSPAKTALGIGSPELEALSGLGGDYPVYAAGGDLVAEFQFLFWKKSQSIGDGVVGKESATITERMVDTRGGSDVLECRVWIPSTAGAIAAVLEKATGPSLLTEISLTAEAGVAIAWQLDLFARDCIHTGLPQAEYFTRGLIAQLIATEVRSRPNNTTAILTVPNNDGDPVSLEIGADQVARDVSCGVNTCSYVYPVGTAVTLTPVTSDGRWSTSIGVGSGSVTCATPCIINLTSDLSVTLGYRPVSLLTVEVSEGGRVSGSPYGISECSVTNSTGCAYDYTRSSVVELTPTPLPGYSFIGWSGCGGIDDDRCTVMMDEDRVLRASFERAGADVIVNAADGTLASVHVGQGGQVDRIVSRVSAAYGVPDRDTGWFLDECLWGQRVRYVVWGRLAAYFWDDGESEVLQGYSYNPTEQGRPNPSEVVLPARVSFNLTYSQALAIFPIGAWTDEVLELNAVVVPASPLALVFDASDGSDARSANLWVGSIPACR